MFARRSDRERPHLDWRVRLFVGGALLAIIGMAMELPWLVWTAVALLLTGFLLRFRPMAEDHEPSTPPEGAGGASPEEHA